MRSALWPDADFVGLMSEIEAYLVKTSELIAAAFVAEEGAGTAGFIELSVRPFSDGCESMPVPHVEGWYVRPQDRGRGVGRALMAAAEEWSRARGFVELASDADLSNVASQLVHEAIGFQEVDRLVKFRKALK